MRPAAPRAPFVLLVGMLLTLGLGTLLFLHTALAEDSFALHDLRGKSAALADREQVLEQEIAQAASPQRLARRAKALGMVRSENPVFISTSDGRILGVPKPGVRPPPKSPPSPTAVQGATTAAGATPAPGAASTAAQATPSASPR